MKLLLGGANWLVILFSSLTFLGAFLIQRKIVNVKTETAEQEIDVYFVILVTWEVDDVISAKIIYVHLSFLYNVFVGMLNIEVQLTIHV